MRPHIPTLQEVISFIKASGKEERKQILKTCKKIDLIGIQSVLFGVTENDDTIQPPRNQHEMVLHTLIFPPDEISIGYWMEVYKTHKWSTRLGDVERILNIVLVDRKWKDFNNRFGHSSKFKVYIPILEKNDYVELYDKLRAIKDIKILEKA